MKNILIDELFKEQGAIVRETAKRTHFSITRIGTESDLKEYRKQQELVKSLDKALSEAKYQVRRSLAIKMVEEQISELKPDAETKYLDNKHKPTKWDNLVAKVRSIRKRNFRNLE